MPELFVYYRVAPDKVCAAFAMVTAFQTNLRLRFPGLQARLLRRPPGPIGSQTWMETYSMNADALPVGIADELLLEVETVAGALAPHIDGPRHIEVFCALTDLQ